MMEVKGRLKNRKVLRRSKLKERKRMERQRMEKMTEKIVFLSCIFNQQIRLHRELSISDVSLIYSRQY